MDAQSPGHRPTQSAAPDAVVTARRIRLQGLQQRAAGSDGFVGNDGIVGQGLGQFVHHPLHRHRAAIGQAGDALLVGGPGLAAGGDQFGGAGSGRFPGRRRHILLQGIGQVGQAGLGVAQDTQIGRIDFLNLLAAAVQMNQLGAGGKKGFGNIEERGKDIRPYGQHHIGRRQLPAGGGTVQVQHPGVLAVVGGKVDLGIGVGSGIDFRPQLLGHPHQLRHSPRLPHPVAQDDNRIFRVGQQFRRRRYGGGIRAQPKVAGGRGSDVHLHRFVHSVPGKG